MKTEHFTAELDFIKSPDIRNFAKLAIENLPDYFFIAAASSSGKYHPKYALGVGGLMRHTRAVATFANTLLQLETYDVFTAREKDLIIVSALLHDGIKQGNGKSGFTVAEHPILCRDWLLTNELFTDKLDRKEIEYMANMIETHMGQWNTSRSGKEILKKPTTKEQRFLHVCDYLASRKNIEVLFDLEEEPAFDPKEYKITFGKHSGKTIQEILKEDKSYLNWLVENPTRIHRDTLKEIKKLL